MKIEKKHLIIIAVVVILIALWYFFLRKKTTTTSNYAGMYGSFGNESGYKGIDSLDASLPMIGRESNYDESNMVDGGSGTGSGGWTKTKHKIKGVTNI